MQPNTFRHIPILVLLGLALFFGACETVQNPESLDIPSTTVFPESQLPEPTEEAVPESSPVPDSLNPEALVELAHEASPLPESIPYTEVTPRPSPIQVSAEVFNKTFSEVEKLIFELNDLIRKRNYDAWVDHLGEEYLQTMSDPRTLREISERPTLKRQNIQLRTLKDYFNSVVVPSRANIRLDDLVFLSETEVEAIMIVGNRRITVYRLIKQGDQWIIGLS